MRRRVVAGVLFTAFSACGLCVAAGAGSPPAGAPTGVVAPPIASVKPYTVESAHGNAMLAHVAPLQKRLYDEIVGRIAQHDSSVPYRDNGWWDAACPVEMCPSYVAENSTATVLRRIRQELEDDQGERQNTGNHAGVVSCAP